MYVNLNYYMRVARVILQIVIIQHVLYIKIKLKLWYNRYIRVLITKILQNRFQKLTKKIIIVS